MFDLLNYLDDPSTRRLLALIFVLILPFFVLFTLIVGTASYLWDWTKTYFSDLKELILIHVHDAFRELIFIIRTGKTINA